MTIIDSAHRFAGMSERIIHNKALPFGGAAVIVPPQNGECVDLLILDPQSDPVQFWAGVQARIAIILQHLADDQARGFPIKR